MSDTSHGGERKGAGRPRIEFPLKTRSVRLTEEHVACAQLLGSGDVSAGVRRALECSTLWTGTHKRRKKM